MEIYLAIYFLIIVLCGVMAHNRGRSPIIWGFLALIIGPLALIVGVLPYGFEKRVEEEFKIRKRLEEMEGKHE